MTSSVAAAAAAVAAEDFGEEDRSSWYADALRQQGGADNLNEFLADVTDEDHIWRQGSFRTVPNHGSM